MTSWAGRRKVWLVGESNPRSQNPEHDLYPHPAGCSGHRLMTVLGLTEREYLAAFRRRNLLRGDRATGPWDRGAARDAALEVLSSNQFLEPVVLLGVKVCEAFGLPAEPFRHHLLGRVRVLTLPHPSGLCRIWNTPGAKARARDMVAALRVGS